MQIKGMRMHKVRCLILDTYVIGYLTCDIWYAMYDVWYICMTFYAWCAVCSRWCRCAIRMYDTILIVFDTDFILLLMHDMTIWFMIDGTDIRCIVILIFKFDIWWLTFETWYMSDIRMQFAVTYNAYVCHLLMPDIDDMYNETYVWVLIWYCGYPIHSNVASSPSNIGQCFHVSWTTFGGLWASSRSALFRSSTVKGLCCLTVSAAERSFWQLAASLWAFPTWGAQPWHW